MIKIFAGWQGGKSNNNNIKIPSPSSILTIVIIMIDFYPAGSSSGRFDFFFLPIFPLEEFGSSSLSFFHSHQ